jgi:hypothetical protein
MRSLRERFAAGLRRTKVWLLPVALVATSAAAAEQAVPARNLSFGPVPAWVAPQAVPLDAAAPSEGLSQGQHFLLADDQVRVSGAMLTEYHHVATRAVNERGVEETANVQIRFDPSYQTLTIHRIEVRRGGRVVSRVAAGAVKLLQRETSLESLIFDGRLTAHIALQDVRVGDVVETVYSRQGRNPVFGDHQFGNFDFDWGVPVAYRHVRLLWPQGRPLYWKLHNGARAARATELQGETEHRWQLRDVPARVVDNGSPGWYDPYAWAEWGEFPDWAAVARWALPLYRLPESAVPVLDREVARIAARTADPEQRLLAALRFVQGEVRYLGIEMGVNSHAPHAPELVLQRRFGDCKDKTLLSLALLQRLGIPARAALVNTQLRQGAADRLPTPWAFNHVLVQADLGGRRVWLDPTRTPQAGQGVEQWVQADFGRALLVEAGTRDLAAMAGPQARAAVNRELHIVLDASAGFDQPATLTVTTRARGESAEQLRDALATTARNDLQKQYLDFYAASYPGLAVDQPYTVRDDRDANLVELIEHYRMPAYWQRDDKRSRWTGELEVPDLMEWLRRPQSLNRRGPLALRHPVDFTLVSEFRLPGAWDVKPDNVTIDDPAFQLRREETWKGSVLVVTDRYRSLADHVAAADVARYAAQLEKARTAVNYQLYRTDAQAPGDAGAPDPPPGTESPHWLPLTVGLLSLGGFVVLGRYLYRWDPTAAPLPPGSVPMTSLGGWLWLPLLGLIGTPIRVGKTVLETLPTLSVQNWAALTWSGSPAYHPLWAPTLLIELVLNLAIVAGALLLLLLMIKRRSSLPRLYICWWLLILATLLGDAIACQAIPVLRDQWADKQVNDAIRASIAAAIWISYFLRSERVSRTFVNRLRPASLPGTADDGERGTLADVVDDAGSQSSSPTPA